MTTHDAEIAVIGAGIVGIATAYYLATRHGCRQVLLVEANQPMALTSAQSGENYRNWWPHPVMTALTDHSIGLMEEIARATGNRFHMSRRGYLLATREAHPDALLEQLHVGYGDMAHTAIRMHRSGSSPSYAPPVTDDWQVAPDGVDVLNHRDLIARHFPDLDPAFATLLHIRRAGDISSQQLGQYMLEEIRAAGGRWRKTNVQAVTTTGKGFVVDVEAAGVAERVRADVIVNAAGPFAGHIATLHGETLPISNVLQQKIAFPDRRRAISRQMPFTIDLDGQSIAWSAEERELLAGDPSIARLLEPMPGNIHCRPDGGEHGEWIKLGWAYNTEPSEPARDPALDAHFPDIVLRAASRMLPRLSPYIGALPRERRHYGGYYTMTAENWPLIGPARTPGVFIATALSGYGTMAACAAGDLCARAIMSAPAPDFVGPLSLARYDDAPLMAELLAMQSRGVL